MIAYIGGADDLGFDPRFGITPNRVIHGRNPGFLPLIDCAVLYNAGLGILPLQELMAPCADWAGHLGPAQTPHSVRGLRADEDAGRRFLFVVLCTSASAQTPKIN